MALVIARLIWGFISRGYARFSSFVPRPAQLVAYFGALVHGRESRYLGHNPAGGVMILALLALLVLVSITGVLIDTPSWRDFRPLREVHAAASNILMILAIIHVLGVLHASYRHRENLIKSMFTGTKWKCGTWRRSRRPVGVPSRQLRRLRSQSPRRTGRAS